MKISDEATEAGSSADTEAPQQQDESVDVVASSADSKQPTNDTEAEQPTSADVLSSEDSEQVTDGPPTNTASTDAQPPDKTSSTETS